MADREHNLITDVIDVVKPLLTQDRRRGLLEYAFPDEPGQAVLNRIDFTGPNDTFAPDLIRQLILFGEVRKGEPALLVLLASLSKNLGVDQQLRFEDLISRLNALPRTSAVQMVNQQRLTGFLKVLVSGSCKQPETAGEYQSFARVCQLLGNGLARAGHTIVAGSSSTQTVDYNVLVGASEATPRARIILLRPTLRHEDDALQIVLANMDVDRRYVAGRWRDIRANQVKAADVVIVVGGGSGTKAVIDFAIGIDKPLFPIAAFPGAARDAWSRMRGKLKKCGMSDETLETLDGGIEVQLAVDSLSRLVQSWSTGGS